MKENDFMLEATINTPNGNEYSRDYHIAIARRTKYYSRQGVVLTRRNYNVGGMTYQVNSSSARQGVRQQTKDSSDLCNKRLKTILELAEKRWTLKPIDDML